MRVWSFVAAAAVEHDVQVVVIPVAGIAAADPELPIGVAMTILDDVDPAVGDVLAVTSTLPAAVLACRLSTVAIGRVVSLALQVPFLVDLDEDDSELHRERGDLQAAHRARELAASHLQRARLITVADEAEVATIRNRYGLGQAVVHAPNSIRLPSGANEPSPGQGGVLFVANLTYWPNVEGARWFTTEVLEYLDEACQIDLVGPAEDTVHRMAGPRVRVHGMVDDLDSYYRQADVVAIPLQYGSGTRIKALEAFAHRRPVVSTTKGVEGLDVVDGVHLLIADDAAAFAAAIAQARRPEVSAHLVASAQHYVSNHHESSAVIAVIAGLIAQATVPLGSALVDHVDMPQDESRPRAVAGLEVNDAGDGLVIYDDRNGQVHHLNGSAAAVFLLCTGELEVPAIATEIADVFALDEPPFEEIAACLTQLRANDLVV